MNGAPKRTPSSSENPTTLDCERKPAPLQIFQQTYRKYHSENAVISPGIRNRIEMRANEQTRGDLVARLDRVRGNYRRHRVAPDMPSGSIQRAISRWHSRMGGERKVRRMLPAFAIVFRKRREPSAPADDFLRESLHVGSSLAIVHHFEKYESRRIKLAYQLRRRPAEENQSNQNFPTISIPVSCDRKVIADHDKDNRNGHESIVFGSQLGLGAERRIECFPGRCRGNHFALRGKNAKPHVGSHDGSEHGPNVDVGGAPAEHMHQSPGEQRQS